MAKVRLESPPLVGPSHHGVATATVPLGMSYKMKQFFGAMGRGYIRRALRRKISRWIMTAAMWLAMYCGPVVPSAHAHHRVDYRDHYHIFLEQKDRLRELDLLSYSIDHCIRHRHAAMIQIEKHLNHYMSNNYTAAEIRAGTIVKTRFDQMLWG
jgi:hypothetical protein